MSNYDAAKNMLNGNKSLDVVINLLDIIERVGAERDDSCKEVEYLEVRVKKLKKKIKNLMWDAEEPQQIDPNVRTLRDRLEDQRKTIVDLQTQLKRANQLLDDYEDGI